MDPMPPNPPPGPTYAAPTQSPLPPPPIGGPPSIAGSHGGDTPTTSDIGMRLAGVVIAIVALNVLWLLLAARDFDGLDWPSHGDTWSAFTDVLTDGFRDATLVEHALATLGRVAFGVVIGTFVGGGFGLVAGSGRTLSNLADPLLSFLRLLTPAAVLLIVQLYRGIGEAPLLVAATLSVIWFVADAIRRLELRPGPMNRINVEALTTVARSALLLTWIVVSFGEVFGSETGLAAAMWSARNFIRLDIVVVFAMVSTTLFVLIDHVTRLVFWLASGGSSQPSPARFASPSGPPPPTVDW